MTTASPRTARGPLLLSLLIALVAFALVLPFAADIAEAAAPRVSPTGVGG